MGADPVNFWADSPPKSGVAPARFGVLFTVTFAGAAAAGREPSIPLAQLPVKKVEKRRLKWVILTFFTSLALVAWTAEVNGGVIGR